jgi:NTE family protein
MPAFFLDGAELADGIALCLSGGGYRAMLFHAGAIWRLNELGLLRKINLVSSVSGGSIASGALAVAWNGLQWDAAGRATNLRDTFIAPILKQAEDAIDYESIVLGLLPWDSAFRHVAQSYERHITGGPKTLQDLPQAPDFVFNTTSLMSGRDWRFTRAYAAGWRVGMIETPMFSLAEVIAASSAFPPFLSPASFDLTGLAVTAPSGKEDLHHPPFTEKALLCDGGVYDDMGLEPAWKRYRTLLVSNAGRPFGALEAPPTCWLDQMRRVVDITMDQDQALRERILIYVYQEKFRTGALWGFNVRADGLGGRPPLLTDAEYSAAKAVRTRLNYFTPAEQALLLKAGYAHAEASLRVWYAPGAGLSTQPGNTPPSP